MAFKGQKYVEMARSNLAAFAPAVVGSTLRTFFSKDPVFRWSPDNRIQGSSSPEQYNNPLYNQDAGLGIDPYPLQIIEESEIADDIGTYPVLVIVKGQTALRRVAMDDMWKEDVIEGSTTRIAIAQSNVLINCFAPDRMSAEYLATSVFACFHFYSDMLRSVFKLHDIEPIILQRSQTVQGNDGRTMLGDLIPVQVKIEWPFVWGQKVMDPVVLQQMFISMFNDPDDPMEERPPEEVENDPVCYTDP